MAHQNRGRMTINRMGDWQSHVSALASGEIAVGTVDIAGVTGALIRTADGTYFRGNGAMKVPLPGRKVEATLAVLDGKVGK